jgi:hypothetical protein
MEQGFSIEQVLIAGRLEPHQGLSVVLNQFNYTAIQLSWQPCFHWWFAV